MTPEEIAEKMKAELEQSKTTTFSSSWFFFLLTYLGSALTQATLG